MPSTMESKPPPGSPPAPAVPTTQPEPQGQARGDLLVKRHIRSGWLIIAVGLIVPLLALGGVYYGVKVIGLGRREMGALLIAVGLAVFLVRMILYLG
jgi:hypothetical protein